MMLAVAGPENKHGACSCSHAAHLIWDVMPFFSYAGHYPDFNI